LNRDIGGAAGDASSSVLSRSDAAGMVSINFYIIIIIIIIIYETRTLLGLDLVCSCVDKHLIHTITLNYVIFSYRVQVVVSCQCPCFIDKVVCTFER
jgi:hypothetical protein